MTTISLFYCKIIIPIYLGIFAEKHFACHGELYKGMENCYLCLISPTKTIVKHTQSCLELKIL